MSSDAGPPDWQALAAAVEQQMYHSRVHGCPEAEVLPVALALTFAGWMSRDTAARYNEAHRVVDRHNRATAEHDRDEARRERDAARQEAAGRCAQLIRKRAWSLTGKYRQEGALAAADWLTTAAWTATTAEATRG